MRSIPVEVVFCLAETLDPVCLDGGDEPAVLERAGDAPGGLNELIGVVVPGDNVSRGLGDGEGSILVEILVFEVISVLVCLD